MNSSDEYDPIEMKVSIINRMIGIYSNTLQHTEDDDIQEKMDYELKELKKIKKKYPEYFI